MAKRCGKYGCGPRANWWRKQLGVDYYSGSGGETPAYTNWWQGIGDVVPLSTGYTIYDPLTAADLAASYVNLANPGTRNATAPTAAPAHAQGTGWTFTAASSQYLNTNTALANLQTVIIWVEDASGIYAIGSFVSSGGVRETNIRPVNASNTTFRRSATNITVPGATRGGILATAGTDAYKNGIDIGNFPAWSGASGLSYFIGCLNTDGVAANFYGGRVLRVAIYNIVLTADQIDAVVRAMMDYQQPADDSYSDIVLASNPICYYTCNQAIGSVLFDKSGNKAHGESYFLPVGQAGLKGLSIAGDGSANDSIKTVGNWAARTGVNMNEFSFACWIKVHVDATNQVRIMNAYTGSQAEYFACEIRNGTNIQVFCKENGVLENSAVLATVTNDTWCHVIGYNSLSAGEYGIYFNGVRHNVVKTLTGFVDQTPDENYPLNAQDLIGNIQHISYYDHALSQAEADALYVP